MSPHFEPNGTVGESRLRVRYAETDQMGVVYHSNFIIWFEVGRVELLRTLGFTYREMEADGYHLPVVEVKCRYKQPARYDDAILIRTCMSGLRSSYIQFTYEVLREEDRSLLAEGSSTHVVVGPDMRPINLSDKYMGPFQRAMGTP